jgi:hypothetical protein
LLDEHPKLPYFKMREAVNGFGGKVKRRDLSGRIEKFLKLIWLAAHLSISCVIPMELYSKIAKGRINPEFDDPYFVAIFDVIMKLIDGRHEANVQDVVEFTFDDNPRLAARVPQWYQLTRALLLPEHRRQIGVSPKFEDDKDFLPLQAADVQSWYFRRLFSERLTKEPFPENGPKELFRHLDAVPSLLSLWDAERLERFVQNGPPKDGPPPPRYKTIHDLLDALELSLGIVK